MMRAPGRISTAWEYPGDGGSVPDLINRTADSRSLLGSPLSVVVREPEKIMLRQAHQDESNTHAESPLKDGG